MRGSRKIFSVFGIDIKLHYSWWFIFLILAYALATGFFPNYFEGLGRVDYWIMGGVAAFLLFFSVLLHELTHSLVARAKKVKVESITLFFFGGVANLPSEEMKPGTELLMAIAGPIFSLILSAVFFAVYLANLGVYVTAITFYLYQLNLILAIFNLLPGYPLDGGRVFRSLLMFYYKDIRKATRIAVKGGKFVAGLLIFLGGLAIVSGMWNGLWFVFLGGFLWFIAGLSYEQVVIKFVLQKIPLTKLMKKSYVFLGPSVTFDKAVKKYYESEKDNLIVEQKKKFLGILDFRRLAGLEKSSWRNLIVRSLMVPAARIKSIYLRESSYAALRKLTEQNLNVLPVVEKGKIKGVVSRATLTHYLMMELRYGKVK